MQNLHAQPVKKEFKYHRLVDRTKELMGLYRENNDTVYLIEDDCILHFFEAEGNRKYEKVASFCAEHGIEKVFDIGCAYGHQSEVFVNTDITYVGVNTDNVNFWNKDKYEFITGHYPCELPTKKGDLGVSVLALTWNVYLYDGEETLKEQCEALQRDFEHVLLYIVPERAEFVGKYFKKVERLEENWFYFSNK